MQNRETALVTGASSGLGVALAEELASRGYDLILTARSKVPMDELAARLRTRSGVNVTVVEADLSQPDGVTDLTGKLDAQDLKPTVVVNNAAFGLNERFVDHDHDRLAAMLRLNVLSLSELSRFYGQRMAAAGRGPHLAGCEPRCLSARPADGSLRCVESLRTFARRSAACGAVASSRRHGALPGIHGDRV